MEKKSVKIRVGGHRPNSRSAFVQVSTEDRERLKRHNWSTHPTGYVIRLERDEETGRRRMVYLHREVMGLIFGDGQVVDHINGNKMDNRRENLRVFKDPAFNAQNVRTSRGSSRFRGVARKRDRWVAKVSRNRKAIHVGTFDREIDAAIAAELKRQELMPYAEPDPALVKVMGERVKLLQPRERQAVAA